MDVSQSGSTCIKHKRLIHSRTGLTETQPLKTLQACCAEFITFCQKRKKEEQRFFKSWPRNTSASKCLWVAKNNQKLGAPFLREVSKYQVVYFTWKNTYLLTEQACGMFLMTIFFILVSMDDQTALFKSLLSNQNLIFGTTAQL